MQLRSSNYRAATFASQNDVKWCHRNFRGARHIEISTVAGSGLFSLISQVFLTYFFIISLKISHFPTISQLFPVYFTVISHFSIISHLFLQYFSIISYFPTMLLISQLHFPTISQLLLNYSPVKVRIFLLYITG